MAALFKSPLGWLRVIGFLEGWSFVILLFIAMPVKYLAGNPHLVRVVGMGHGVLFMAYVGLVLYVMVDRHWVMKRTALALGASLVPFGTFWAEFRIFRDAQWPKP